MGKVHSHANGSLGPLKIFDGQGTTNEISVTLEMPCRLFTVQITKTSTSATLTVAGHITPLGGSTIGSALFSFAASTAAGSILSTESTGPLSRLSFNHAAGASTGGLSVWLTASP